MNSTLNSIFTAGSKWNFLPFRPGLVGGHCIGVDPYYLTHKAQEIGYHLEVILAGRRINDSMAGYVADEVVKLMTRRKMQVVDARILVLGLTFKEANTYNAIILAVVHPEFLQLGAAGIHAFGKPGHVLHDVKCSLKKTEADGRL